MELSAEGQAGAKDWGIKGVWVAMAVVGVDKISQKEGAEQEGRGTEDRMLGTRLGIPSLPGFELFFPVSKIFTENIYLLKIKAK